MNSRLTHPSRVVAILAIAVSACSSPERDKAKIESLGALNVIDENNLNEIMLDFADPKQAVGYFQKSLAQEPDRVDFQRGFARSLMRAKRPTESAAAFKEMDARGNLNNTDRLFYAEALIQSANWQEAERQLDAVPPTVETYDRYRLEAMIADFQKEWTKSDSFYDIARGLTTRPAPIYNNWGISKMARGDRRAAEEMFIKAISYDQNMFSAKNNLAISRAKRKIYDLPAIPMKPRERAELYHNIALQAIRNGDVEIGRGLLEQALETHPQHFDSAQTKLDALGQNILR